jgi:uncharacterized membrane protein YkvA (DUF1232 family)
MKCPNCEKEIADNSKVCKYCGFNIERYRNITEKGIDKISDNDVQKAYQKAERALNKAKKLSEGGGPFAPLVKRIKIFVSLLRDYMNKNYKQVPWRVIAAIVFAIIYFLNPFDLIFDFIPGVGYIDDAAVIAFIFASLEYELKKYAKWKGIDFE